MSNTVLHDTGISIAFAWQVYFLLIHNLFTIHFSQNAFRIHIVTGWGDTWITIMFQINRKLHHHTI